MPVGELDRLRAEPHRPAEVLDLLLLGQQVDHGVRRLRVHLGRVRALEPEHVPGELADRHVHAEADAEIGDSALAGDPAGEDLALPPARAEAARHEDAVDLVEPATASSYDMCSASTQRTFTRTPWCTPACFSASCTER